MFLLGDVTKIGLTAIDRVIMILYDVLSEESKVRNKKSSVKEGFSFEDRVSQKAYECIRGYPISVFPPRSTLNYPTVSGLKHQFDGIVSESNIFYVIECKKRGITVIDQVFSFNSKILDYALEEEFTKDFRIKGIFLCTARINDNIRKYALAHGILPLDLTLPPIQVMINKTEHNDRLRQELEELKQLLMLPQPIALKSRVNIHELFQRYTISYQKWKSRGYE